MHFTRFSIALLTSIFIANHSVAIEEIVVTGSYSAVAPEQLSSSISVITSQQLMQLSRHSLVAALRQVPSIWVEEQGGPGGITSISLRGAESNHTLVLLDGVQLNDPTNTRGGAFDLGNINIEMIQRIEIIRGAQSSVYGSDALAGVIQIFTTEAGKKHMQLNAAVGEDGYKAAGVSRAGSLNDLGYAVSAQTKDAGEPLLGSTAKNTELIGKLNWGNTRHKVDATYRYFDGERTTFPEQSGGPRYAVSRELDSSKFTDTSAAFGWQLQANDVWQSHTRATWYNRVENIASPGVFNALPSNAANTDFTRTLFSWINTLGNEKSAWSNIGLERKHESGSSLGYVDYFGKTPTDFELSRTINSAFVNVNGFVCDKLLLQTTIRRDVAKNIATKNNLQAGARYQINESTFWFVNKNEGFKLPSFLALGHPLVGDINLLPEESNTWDMGIEWARNAVTTRVSYFDNQYKNLIDFDSDTFKNVNRTRVDTAGVEAEMSWQANSQWWLQLHGTYTDIDMLSSSNHLLGRPQVTVGSSLSYAVNAKWKVNANYLWVDQRFAVSRYSDDTSEKILNAYSRVDANINWQATSQLQLGLSLENALDKQYDNDIGFPGIGLSAKFNMVLVL